MIFLYFMLAILSWSLPIYYMYWAGFIAPQDRMAPIELKIFKFFRILPQDFNR